MNPNNKDPDTILDDWLQEQPIQTIPARTEAIVARIRKEEYTPTWVHDSIDKQIDDWLAQRPIPSSTFRTEALVQALKREIPEAPARKRFAVSGWMLALGGMSAALMLGILAFAALFQHASKQDPQGNLAAHQIYMQSLQAPQSSTPYLELAMLDEIIYFEDMLAGLGELTDNQSWESLAYVVY